jgi:cellulose biosynthesis protein BcsQ
MKIVSVINYKGGVGKTSLTANLGAELAWRRKRVLLIDLDAQASLTFSFITPDEWENHYEAEGTIKSWFDSFESGITTPLSDLVQSPTRIAQKLIGKGNLDIIYSHLGLINVDLELATSLGGANLAQAKKNFIAVHKRLASGLEELAKEGQYDIVLIDCPPNFNIVTKTAIIASDYILVPTRPDELSTLGIDYLMRYYDRRKNHYKMQGKPISRIVSILELAQAVMAAALGRPADARARPSTVLNNEGDYDQLFNDKYPITLYPQATLLLRRSESYLYDPAKGLPRKDQNNLRFYLMRRALIEASKKKKPGVQDLADLKEGVFTDKLMDAAFGVVYGAYQKLGSTDQVAKGVELEKEIAK